MKYSSGPAFREAIEQRLKNELASKPPTQLDRRRKQIVFDRLLARLLVVAPDEWILKGGVALEYRLEHRARATRDLDLASDLKEPRILGLLLEAASVDLEDYFVFSLEPAAILDHGDAIKTLRYRITAQLAGRRFETITLDVGQALPPAEEIDIVFGSDFLGFAGIERIAVPTISLAQHLIEKLQAYTQLYGEGRQSSRIKDLVDIVLVVANYPFVAEQMLARLKSSFDERHGHQAPSQFPLPPDDWVTGYRTMAGDIELDPDVRNGHRVGAAFFDQLLAGSIAPGSRWSPDTQTWNRRESA